MVETTEEQKLKLYEGMFLVSAREDSLDDTFAHIHGIITKYGGEIAASEKWAERRLAYEIAHHKRGIYLLVHFNAPPTSIRDINNDCQLSEIVVRHMISVDEDGIIGKKEAEDKKASEIDAGDAPGKASEETPKEVTEEKSEETPEEVLEKAPEEAPDESGSSEDAPAEELPEDK